MINNKRKIIAFESRLRKCNNVITLGVKTNFSDYSHTEQVIINNAKIIYYPSSFYVSLFHAYGKKVFPSWNNYNCAQNKIKQTSLFKICNLPHPKTRLFYGKKQKQQILDYFQYPFIAKIAKGSSMGRGVFMISNREDLDLYLSLTHVAYIQEYFPIDRDMRIVIVGTRVVHAYWRVMKLDEFRSNVTLGANIKFDPIPPKALELALNTALKCGWNDVGIDICQYDNQLYLLEANMKYGYKGFVAAGIDYSKLMEKMIEEKYI